MAGLIAMTSVLIVVGIEMFFASRGAGHMHVGDHEMLQGTEVVFEGGYSNGIISTTKRMDSVAGVREPGARDEASRPMPNGGRTYYVPEEEEDADIESDEDADEAKRRRREEMEGFIHPAHQYHTHSPATSSHHHGVPDSPGDFLSEQQQEKKLLLQCLLLEAGILFHSVFIGMALSVATGTSFIVLLVAISFHRRSSLPLIKLCSLIDS